MNIIEQGRVFAQRLCALTQRTEREWRRCPWCGSTWTSKNGSYLRHPWMRNGRQTVRIQRHRCFVCGRSYGEEQAGLVRRSWYGRAVHR